MIERIKSSVAKWWEGEVKVLDPPFVGLLVERHWTARTISTIGIFLKKEWKWVLGFLVACAGIYFKAT